MFYVFVTIVKDQVRVPQLKGSLYIHSLYLSTKAGVYVILEFLTLASIHCLSL